MEPFDNLAEYADPELYDLENQDFEPDGKFYLELAQQLGGAVLEIGCGTGRITIPMAQAGVDITGLDVVPAMLERARAKAVGTNIKWVEADARSFQLEQKFNLIFESGSAFAHMLTRVDQDAFLSRVREHLEPEGRFVVGLFFPQLGMLEDVKEEQEWYTYHNEQGQEVRVSGIEVYDPLSQVKRETAYRRWKDDAGNEVVRVAPLSLRYTFPQEIEALLYFNGFWVIERYGDYTRSPLAKDSQLMIFVCKKR